MTNEELYRPGLATLVGSWEEDARGASSAEVRRWPGVAVAVFPNEPERAVYNNALLARDLAAAERAEALDAMEATYAAAGVTGYAAWVHESDAAMRADVERRGYTLHESTRAMGMALDDIRVPRPQIELGHPDWFEYLRIVGVAPTFLQNADRAAYRILVARLDGANVATAMAYDVAGDCGIYTLVTLEHARRRGLGTALTALHLHDRPAPTRRALARMPDRQPAVHEHGRTAVRRGRVPRPRPDPRVRPRRNASTVGVTERQPNAKGKLMTAAVYLQTNDAAANEIIAFSRSEDGTLSPLGRYDTGGRGTGQPHLASQGSVVLSDDGRWLVAVNAGSDDISLFAVETDGLRLADRIGSAGTTPTSVAVAGTLAYVANNASATIAGFTIEGGRLAELEGSTRPLSIDGADPAQIAFSRDARTLAVTERATDSISTYAIDARGYADGPTTVKAAGKTPYGFDFTDDGVLIVTEAFGGDIGAAAASSYAITDAGKLTPVTRSVGDTRSEVCWAAVTKDGRFAYVTNFGDGTISSYAIGDRGALELREAVAGSTRLGEKGIRDEAITHDGRYLYAIDPDAQKVYGWRIAGDGQLEPIGDFEGVPPTMAGLAAS